MKKYTAVAGKRDGRIISVGASNEAEAKAEITRQLNRPGRREILRRWREDGERVIKNETAQTIQI